MKEERAGGGRDPQVSGVGAFPVCPQRGLVDLRMPRSTKLYGPSTTTIIVSVPIDIPSFG